VPQPLLSAALISPSAQPGMGNPSSNADFPPQGVTGVFPHYSFQAYAGYTFVRVYALPGREVNRNGFDLSMSYYVKNSNIGVEGALSTTFGSIANERSDFVFAGGGPRVRWSAPRGTELWAHGLIGGANFGPSIAGFSQSALAYEVGGGIDINAHLQHFAFRLEGDMVGTRLYSTTQYSPKVTAGIVYKF
jgi:hypothetical protein